MTDCKDWYFYGGQHTDGIYAINPDGRGSFNVFCDMTTDDGGWTVFQRRIDDKLSFYNNSWNDYKTGFNNGLENNLWLGNDVIHILTTKDSNVELRIDLWGDRYPYSSDPSGYWWEKRSNFWIDNEASFYKLHLSSNFTGNATLDPYNNMYDSNNMNFSTVDKNNGADPQCFAKYERGAWWLGSSCAYVSLNGKYIPTKWGTYYGFCWNLGPNDSYINPTQSRMMLRTLSLPKDCSDIYQTTSVDGVYAIQLPNNNVVNVYCDITGGGWTVIQSRESDGIYFNRTYDEYKSNFGDAGGSFWLGLENIHSLTLNSSYSLRIDLCCHDISKSETYDYFYVADSADKYRLNVSNGTGEAQDGLNKVAYTLMDNGSPFSTSDNYNSVYPKRSCSSFRGYGGWWFGSCTNNLNGYLYTNPTDYSNQDQCQLVANPTNGPGITWDNVATSTKARMKVIPYSQLPSLIRDSAFEQQQLAAFCSF
uniref:Fibrinogen C-terminal domain-containing protein n=1 Tax=Plectus sambesii TaxID=2011161 RepID=A0A914XEN7_9BILA